MTARFDAFVLFAEMRTGSNHLEESLNAFPDIHSYGEVYNPTFLGHHNQFSLFGYDMDRREADPVGLLDKMIAETKGIPEFRLFHDHDQRVVDAVLPNPRIAKVILRRNPLDSYISRKIASATGQGRLTDMKHARNAKIRFDEMEFRHLIGALGTFQEQLRRRLQVTGQTAFHIRYEDITDAEIINGLARFLGSRATLEQTPGKLKKQNPSPMRDKVENFEDMSRVLQRLDPFELEKDAEFEPSRQAQVPTFVAHPDVGLLFLPVKGGPDAAIIDWMARIGGVGRKGLLTKMTQQELRSWMKAHTGYRSFSVLRHPVLRPHVVFNRFILADDRPMYSDPRKVLRQRYKLPIPNSAPGEDWTAENQKEAFKQYLGFLKGNLAGQTSLRVDQAWATQTAVLQGISGVTLPHRIFTEDDMVTGLSDLARDLGIPDAPQAEPEELPGPVALDDIYDGKVEQATIEVYRRDYQNFGFPRWNKR